MKRHFQRKGRAKLTRQNRWIYYLIGYLYFAITYLVTNHADLGGKHFLPLTFLDQGMPFLPWTGWIYVSAYVMPLTAALVVTRDKEFYPVLGCFVTLATICCAVFLIFPTTYPRPALAEGTVNSVALEVTRKIDTPANCFPSAHVGFAFLSAFFIARYSAFWGNFLVLWALLVSVSTLTTKQHYVWDVIAGYFLARFIFVYFESKYLKQRKPKKPRTQTTRKAS